MTRDHSRNTDSTTHDTSSPPGMTGTIIVQ